MLDSCVSSVMLLLFYVTIKVLQWGGSYMPAFHSIHEACPMQGSPSTFTPTDRESFRRGASVTSWRAGKDGKPYLYTLNLACPEERWAELGKLYHKAAESFKLTPPTKVSTQMWNLQHAVLLTRIGNHALCDKIMMAVATH